MKLLCHLFTRYRSNKKKETIKSSSFLPLQSFNQSASSYSDQTSCLFDQQSRCTCHYFNLNKTYSTELTNNRESSIETKYILTLDDFCFYYDIRSTLLDLIDRVIAIEEIPSLRIQQNPSTIIKYCLPPSNPIYRKKRKEKSSIAIQTSADFEQKRNAKVQANTLTLSPLRNYF